MYTRSLWNVILLLWSHDTISIQRIYHIWGKFQNQGYVKLNKELLFQNGNVFVVNMHVDNNEGIILQANLGESTGYPLSPMPQMSWSSVSGYGYPNSGLLIRWKEWSRRWSSLPWYHNELAAVSNHQPHECLFNRFFHAQIKENIKAPRHWPLCGNSPMTSEFPAQRASYAENVYIWWRHYDESHKPSVIIFRN